MPDHTPVAQLPPGREPPALQLQPLMTPALPPAPAMRDPAFAEEPAADWRRIASALLRYKWLIGLVTLLGTAAGVAGMRFVSPEYLAEASLWIEGDRRGGGGLDRGQPIRSRELLDNEGWVDLLKSYVVLDGVVRETRSFAWPKSPADARVLSGFDVAKEFRPGAYRFRVDGAGRGWVLEAADGVELQRGALGDSVGARLGFRWAPGAGTLQPGRAVEFSVVTLRQAAQWLAEGLDVRMVQQGSIVRLGLRGPDPRRVTTLVNAIAQRFVAVAAELKREKLTELSRIVEDQLGAAGRDLREAEAALERFRVRTITLPPDRPGAASGGDPLFTQFFSDQMEQDQLLRDREAIARVLTQAASGGVSVAALATIEAVRRSADLEAALKELNEKQATLRTLRYRYADEYPPIQRLVADIAVLERETIPALARALVSELGLRQGQLKARVGSASRDLRQIPPRAIEEARLRRDVEIANTLFTTLQQRHQEARLAEASSIPDVRILDEAVVPQWPVKDLGPRLLLMALVGSLGVGVLGAVLLDRLDPKVRYPEQVSRGMGLTILGAVPHLKGGDGRGGKTDEVLEALRGIRLNLLYAYGAAGPVTLALSSPGAGDGKSFICANLALAFADAGYRTLLIDGDIRRGTLHRLLNAVRKPGLTDYLRGEAPLERIVQSTSYPALDLIGCGTRTQNAPELLASPAMPRLLAAVRPRYGVILVDTPPLGAGVDPFVLSTVTGNLLLILRTGISHREVTEAKLEVLSRLPVRILGAVLNDVPPGVVYRYYSYYLPGYESSDEPSTETPRKVLRRVP